MTEATGYAYQYREDGEVNWPVEQTVPASTVTLTGLDAQTTYEFKVRAYDASNRYSGYSELDAITRLPVPTGLSVSDPTYDGVSLDWDDVTGATGYEYRYKESSAANWDDAVVAAVTDSEATVTGLSGGTQYDFSVRATNADTESLWTSEETETTLAVGRVSLGEDVSVAEGATVNITVTSTVAPQSAFTVNYSIGADDDTATVDGDSDDYVGSSTGSIVIAAGATQGIIPVVINDDSDIDDGARESLMVTITIPEVPSHQLGDNTSATVTITEGVCDRTSNVRTAILGKLSDISECAQVTDSDLSGTTDTLDLSGQSITELKARDFRGLSGLQQLWLNGNSLTSLPDDVFDGLTSLTTLRLNSNSLASLPDDVFDDLAGLTTLYLNNNSLASLPEGVFGGLTTLQELYLQSNSGSPFTFTVELEQTVANQVEVSVSDATPFTIAVSLSVAGGTLSANSVAIPAGSSESQAITLTPSGNGQVAVGITAANFPTSGVETNGVTYNYQGVRAGVGAANQAPDAQAGADKTVATEAEVTLDASGTSDSDTGDTLSYSWTQTAGTTVTLSSASVSGPTFTAPSSATTLTFQITVLDGRGGSDRDTVDIVVVVPPAAPSNLSATRGGGQITLDWDDPDDASITGYEYRMKEGTSDWSNWTAIPNSNATTVEYVKTGLTNGTAYTSEVRAVNSGVGGAAAQAGPVTPMGVPTNIRETADSTSSITWSWNAVSGATSYEYQVRRRSGATTWGSLQTTTSMSGSSSSLSSSATYEIQVRSVKGTASSAWSDPVTGTTDAVVIPKLSVPANVHVDASTTTTITFDWNTHSVSGTGYRYRYRKAGTSSYTYGTSNSSQVKITSLESGTSYEFSVRAERTGYRSSSYSSAITAVTIPSTPTGLSIQSRTSTSVTLTWDASRGATQYTLEFDGTEYVVSGTSRSFTGLVSSSTHSARVRAENNAGDSSYSSVLEIVLPLAIPTGLTSTRTADTLIPVWIITVNWNAVPGATQYRLEFDGTEYVVTGTSKSFGGLASASTHSVRVRAENSAGHSSYSSSLSIALPPTRPTGLTATYSGNSITAEWNASDGATSYTIYIGGSATVSATSYTRTGLSYGVKYRVQVIASNSVGDSQPSLPVYVTIPLNVPTNVRLTGQTAHTISLAWDSVTDADDYYVAITPDNGQTISTFSSTVPSITISNLNAGTTYQLKVQARRDLGTFYRVSGYSSYVSGTTTIPLPGTPTVNGIGVNGSHIPSGKGQLRWSNPNPDYAGIGASYRIEYEVQTRQVDRANNEYIGEWEPIDSGTTNNSHSVFVDINPAGWLERARVRAHNATGNSAWSEWHDPLAE